MRLLKKRLPKKRLPKKMIWKWLLKLNFNVSEDAPTNPFADDVHVEDDSSNNDVLGELPSGGDASVDNDPYHKMLVESAIDYSFADRLDYFSRGGPITMKIRAAVETCVLGKAGK
jgi:hypothetical protein